MFNIGDKVLYSPVLGCDDSRKKTAEVISDTYEVCGTQCVKITGVRGVVAVDNLELIEKTD